MRKFDLGLVSAPCTAEEFRQAAVDPDFLAACEEVEREFEAADAETASLIR